MPGMCSAVPLMRTGPLARLRLKISDTKSSNTRVELLIGMVRTCPLKVNVSSIGSSRPPGLKIWTSVRQVLPASPGACAATGMTNSNVFAARTVKFFRTAGAAPPAFDAVNSAHAAPSALKVCVTWAPLLVWLPLLLNFQLQLVTGKSGGVTAVALKVTGSPIEGFATDRSKFTLVGFSIAVFENFTTTGLATVKPALLRTVRLTVYWGRT